MPFMPFVRPPLHPCAGSYNAFNGAFQTQRRSARVKPKLLVVELWGMGDLVIATPFLQAASEKYEVTLIAKPYARDLQARFWQDVKVVSFVAPWTAFERKYYLLSWPWREMFRLRRRLKV